MDSLLCALISVQIGCTFQSMACNGMEFTLYAVVFDIFSAAKQKASR